MIFEWAFNHTEFFEWDIHHMRVVIMRNDCAKTQHEFWIALNFRCPSYIALLLIHFALSSFPCISSIFRILTHMCRMFWGIVIFGSGIWGCPSLATPFPHFLRKTWIPRPKSNPFFGSVFESNYFLNLSRGVKRCSETRHTIGPNKYHSESRMLVNCSGEEITLKSKCFQFILGWIIRYIEFWEFTSSWYNVQTFFFKLFQFEAYTCL